MTTSYQEAFVAMPDKQEIYYRVSGPAKPKAAILLAHGLAEHCGRYEDFCHYLNSQGYLVYRYDHRGHGKTPGIRAYAKRFSDLYEDMSRMVDFVEKDSGFKKPYLIAHSFGGQIAVNFLAHHPKKVKAAVLSSPNLKLGMKLGWIKKHAGRFFSRVAPTFVIRNEVNADHLSHDPSIVQAYRKDPLVEKNITLGLGAMILDNLEQVLKLAPKIQTPCLLFHGNEDQIINPEGTQNFYKAMTYQDKTLKMYEGFYHECLNELAKKEVYADIGHWLNQH